MQEGLQTKENHEDLLRIKLCKLILAIFGINNLRLYQVNNRVYVSKEENQERERDLKSMGGTPEVGSLTQKEGELI